MTKRWIYWLPVTILAALIAAFVAAFLSGRDPSALPSALLNQNVPENFSFIDLTTQKQFSRSVFDGRVSLVNFFASWCAPCLLEHPLLIDLKNRYPVQMIGISYRDSPQNIRRYIETKGNPYDILFVPPMNAPVALDWGIAGVPETFVVDRHGVIRYRFAGPIDAETIEPLIKNLLER